jgi:hypothetical protein
MNDSTTRHTVTLRQLLVLRSSTLMNDEFFESTREEVLVNSTGCDCIGHLCLVAFQGLGLAIALFRQ